MSLAPENHRLPSRHDPRAVLHVRACGPRGGTPVVLVHGFFQPATAILDVPGWSLQQALAAKGLRVVLFDLRGYGLSSRPGFMDEPPGSSRPSLGCLADAVADIADVVDHVRESEGQEQVDLLGYSWGTARSAAFAIQRPGRVRRLVLYAPVWRPRTGAAAEAASPDGADRLDPRLGGYRTFGPGDLTHQWDTQIGQRDPMDFRDPAALVAAERALIASDPALHGRGYRAPLGPMVDALEVARGRPLFDASALRGEVLLLRGDCDPLSSAADAAGLLAALGSATSRLVTIRNGTHLLHLEHARRDLTAEIAGFLRASGATASPPLSP